MHELESWAEEKRSAYLYRLVSDTESGNSRQVLFLELAKAADEQAELWAREVRKMGATIPAEYRPDIRTRVVGWLVRRLGTRALRPVLAAMKVRGMVLYSEAVGHAMPSSLGDVGRRHNSVGGGNLRAAVFGVNDGLVSNASLIFGVAGASSDPAVILLSGIAGLLAGAFSMAAGEYLSVRSQRDMFEHQIALERAELQQYPQQEAAELRLIFEAKGLSVEEAQRLANTLIADPDRALDTMAREELGLSPEQLGSPWGAAAFSFGAFAAGACVPLLPFLLAGLFVSHTQQLVATAGLSSFALFAVGAALSLFSGRNAVLGGARMLLIGAAAAGTTYVIGRAVGVSLG